MALKLNQDHKNYLDKSVLCWLATVDKNGIPNVSPKEIFTYVENEIIIANIASPRSVKNIHKNNNVCLSFIDILSQKGFKFMGTADILIAKNEENKAFYEPLKNMAGDRFLFNEIIRIKVLKAQKILAPSYQFYPETKESEQIEAAKKIYGI